MELPKEEFRFDNIPLSAIGAGYYNQPLSIGAQNQPVEPFFAYGVLDEVRFYANTILTDEQIAVLVNPGTAGDFNGDGLVDAADYTAWQDNVGAGDEASIGENGDRADGVNQADYDLWITNFGMNVPVDNDNQAMYVDNFAVVAEAQFTSGEGLGGSTIPESPTCALVAWAFVSSTQILYCKRRQFS